MRGPPDAFTGEQRGHVLALLGTEVARVAHGNWSRIAAVSNHQRLTLTGLDSEL